MFGKKERGVVSGHTYPAGARFHLHVYHARRISVNPIFDKISFVVNQRIDLATPKELNMNSPGFRPDGSQDNPGKQRLVWQPERVEF